MAGGRAMIYKRKTKAGKTRWVAKIYLRTTADGKKLDKHVGTFDSCKDAKRAEAQALAQYGGTTGDETIADFAARWLADYPRPRASTNRTHSQAVKRFVGTYGTRQPQTITRKETRAWALAHPSSHASLRAMWGDMAVEEIVIANPWSNLRLPQSKGRAEIKVATREEVALLMHHARQFKHGPHGEQYASMIEFAAYTGMRRGELCVLTWADVDFKARRIAVTKTLSDDREVLPPKNGKARSIVLPPQAAAALQRLARPLDASGLIFATSSGRRYSKSTWHYHWEPVRCAAGKPNMDFHELRHYCATYLVQTLRLSYPDAAHQLGHTDGGELLRRLYAHPDEEQTLDEIARAFEREANGTTGERDGGAEGVIE
jgi:integrase